MTKNGWFSLKALNQGPQYLLAMVALEQDDTTKAGGAVAKLPTSSTTDYLKLQWAIKLKDYDQVVKYLSCCDLSLDER